MALIYDSTIIEVGDCLEEICFRILNALLPEFWQERNQIIYSVVDDWDTAYRQYLEFNKNADVKFPFGSITRGPTQVTFNKFGSAFTAVNRQVNELNPKGVKIKPVRCMFNLTLYEKQYGTMEKFVDYLIACGHIEQRVDFDSRVLEAPSRFSFQFDEPEHKMIPDKTERQEGKGHIYAVTIPIIVDTVLGIDTDEKLIAEIIADIITSGTEERTIITDQDC